MKLYRLHSAILLSLSFILFSCNSNITSNKDDKTEKDSIAFSIGASKNTSFPLAKRKRFLEKSFTALQAKKSDTLARGLSKIAYRYLKLKDTAHFHKINKQAQKEALKHNDTFALADTHWSIANLYKKKEVYDSAYYHYNKAYHYFEAIDKQYDAAKMLYGMAFIKGRYRDYSGSEVLVFKAISKYKVLKKNKSLYASYNYLALMQNDIKEYNKALFYNNKALDYLNKLSNKKDFLSISFNNIGLVYVYKGNYDKALYYFNKALKTDSLRDKNIEQYARVIDNRAHCRLLNKDTANVKKELIQALRVRDSLDIKAGIVISKIHLATYFGTIKDTAKAMVYAKEANVMAKHLKNGRDYLASLKLLSKLDKKRAENYLGTYIDYADSLQNIDHKTQNKFMRIAYETDEYIQKNQHLLQQEYNLAFIAIGVLAIFSLLYYARMQKLKNDKLFMEIDQQKTNEQLYILMLRQQTKLEEEKNKERNRISEELHDSVLGKLFGTRVNLGFIDVNGNEATQKQYDSLQDELLNIEKEIRAVTHKLNSNLGSTEIDFGSLLERLLSNKSKIGKFSFQIKGTKVIDWTQIDEDVKVNLVRIFQEALQNIIKYAKATNVILNIYTNEDNFVFSLKDDGIGFDIKRAKKGIGIKNIKSRIQKLKGIFNLYSELGKGTTLNFTIPKN